MKKIFFIILFLGFHSASFEVLAKKQSTSVAIKKDRFGKKSKDGSFKRKRGGFLGIFGKKKSSCDCPRH